MLLTYRVIMTRTQKVKNCVTKPRCTTKKSKLKTLGPVRGPKERNETIELAYRPITKHWARLHELRLVNMKIFDKDSSFRDLFKKRIDSLNKPYRKTIITGKYTIQYIADTVGHLINEQEKEI